MVPAKILIVEDEGIVAEEIRSRLKNKGYAVSGIVHTGEAAIQKAEELHPDLVLMDIRLKGEMGGIEAARKIQERFNIPVVYLTAYADDSTLQRAKATHPYGYVIKPFEENELHVAVEIALARNQAQAERLKSEKLQAVIEMAGAVCHELNQPMMAISGYSELLLLKQGDDHPLYENLTKIIEQIERMGEITQKLMKITRYETKSYGKENTIIDLDKSSSLNDIRE